MRDCCEELFALGGAHSKYPVNGSIIVIEVAELQARERALGTPQCQSQQGPAAISLTRQPPRTLKRVPLSEAGGWLWWPGCQRLPAGAAVLFGAVQGARVGGTVPAFLGAAGSSADLPPPVLPSC